MSEQSNDALFLMVMIIFWALMSHIFARWITQNLYLIETVSLLLIFGIIYEVWSSFEVQDNVVQVAAASGDAIGRSTAQAFLIAAVSGMVLASMFMRQWVESVFGPLAAVQLLAIVGILSRAFVNVRSGGDVLEILDGSRSTRIVYIAGFLALVISQFTKGSYPAYTVAHNSSVIFLSTAPPLFYYFFIADEGELRSLRQHFAGRT